MVNGGDYSMGIGGLLLSSRVAKFKRAICRKNG